MEPLSNLTTIIMGMKEDHNIQEEILFIDVTVIVNNVGVVVIEDFHMFNREKQKYLKVKRLNCVKDIE